MTAEEAFLSDVGSWPIFADWLEEQGQIERAALFRRPRFRNSLGMEFVLVPRGKFWMGGGGGKPGDREVTIPHDFYLGAYPVTQEQWLKLMPSNPSYFSRSDDGKDWVRDIPGAELMQFPVEQVSWDMAQEFLQKLNAWETAGGWTYRLPTEEEWEYACRGAPVAKEACSFDFYFAEPSNDLSTRQANFIGTYPGGKGKKGAYTDRTTRVGSYQPNRLGLYDMHGNVWEWTSSSQVDWNRVIRGGCWKNTAVYGTAGNRGYYMPDFRFKDLGFRVLTVRPV